MLFDSHAHYDDARFDEDREKIINQVHDQGIKYILNVASNIQSSRKCIYLSKKFDFIYATVGIHPHDAKDANKHSEDIIYSLSKGAKVVAIGEIGLDYYYDNSPRDVQKQWFRNQINIAKDLKLPIVVHTRDAIEDTLEVIKAENARQIGGVFHCYSSSIEVAKIVLGNNFYISFGGPITFKNAKKTLEVLEYIPMDRILVETDCPYLTPEPYRGKRNHSGYLKHIVEKIAEIKHMSFDKAAEITAQNAKSLFKIN